MVFADTGIYVLYVQYIAILLSLEAVKSAMTEIKAR